MRVVVSFNSVMVLTDCPTAHHDATSFFFSSSIKEKNGMVDAALREKVSTCCDCWRAVKGPANKLPYTFDELAKFCRYEIQSFSKTDDKLAHCVQEKILRNYSVKANAEKCKPECDPLCVKKSALVGMDTVGVHAFLQKEERATVHSHFL